MDEEIVELLIETMIEKFETKDKDDEFFIDCEIEDGEFLIKNGEIDIECIDE